MNKRYFENNEILVCFYLLGIYHGTYLMVCKITRSSNHEAQVIVARLQWPSLNDLAANFLYFVYLHPHALTTEQSGQAMRRGLWGTG